MQLKKYIKKILKCKDNETVMDALYRHKIFFQKQIYKKKISVDEFKETLKEVGLKNGDNIMVHASWRAFFNYLGTPKDIIDSMLDIIGKNGTLVMPCYGKNKCYFDVDNDKSVAGVLSETFRTYKGVERSRGSHFACAAIGKETKSVINEHELSRYGFDEYSPYAKFTKLDNAKIIMLGLGKNSVKLSLYHLPEMILKDKDVFYKELFKKTYSSNVIYKENGRVIKKKHESMLLREATLPNRKNIKKLYKQKFVIHRKISNIDIVILDAQKTLAYILEEARKGNYMIKRHWKKMNDEKIKL